MYSSKAGQLFSRLDGPLLHLLVDNVKRHLRKDRTKSNKQGHYQYHDDNGNRVQQSPGTNNIVETSSRDVHTGKYKRKSVFLPFHMVRKDLHRMDMINTERAAVVFIVSPHDMGERGGAQHKLHKLN